MLFKSDISTGSTVTAFQRMLVDSHQVIPNTPGQCWFMQGSTFTLETHFDPNASNSIITFSRVGESGVDKLKGFFRNLVGLCKGLHS
jgi:hypothetical protein